MNEFENRYINEFENCYVNEFENIQVYGRSQSQLMKSDWQPEHCTGVVAAKFLDTSNNKTNCNKEGFCQQYHFHNDKI